MEVFYLYVDVHVVLFGVVMFWDIEAVVSIRKFTLIIFTLGCFTNHNLQYIQ